MGMTEAEFEEFWAEKAREIARPTNRPKRRQPRHKGGLVSSRQKIALSQESNPVKAIYNEDRNPTPIRDGIRGTTREVGPGDEYNPMWALQRIGRGESGEC